MFRTQKPWVRVYEGHASPEIEVQKGSLTDLFRAAVEEHRDKTALTFYGATLDFARLEALSERMAASLTASGVKKGDRVALMLPNCPHYVTHLTHEPISAPGSRKLCNSWKAACTALRYMRERRAKWFSFVASFIRSSFTNAQIEAKQWLDCVLIVLVGDLANEALDFNDL